MTANRRSLMKGMAWAVPTAVVVVAAPAYAASPCPLASATRAIPNVQLALPNNTYSVPAPQATSGTYYPLIYPNAKTRDSSGKPVAANDPVFNGLYIPAGKDIALLSLTVASGKPALTDADLSYDRNAFTVKVSGSAPTFSVAIKAKRDIYLTEALKNGYNKSGFAPFTWIRSGDTPKLSKITFSGTFDALSRDTYIENGVCKNPYLPIQTSFSQTF